MATETETKSVSNGGTEEEEAVSNRTEPASELETKIIEQIEYYFGDINLARDKFLQEEIQKTEEGWVELSTMLKFVRLKKLTEDAKVIVDALKKSTNDLLQVSEDGEKIRRNPEKVLPSFDGDYVKDLITQSLYLKHFPRDVTLDEIKDFFKKNTSDDVKIQNVIMRHYRDKLSNEKKFKGSIFATFNTKENAEKFLNENKDKGLKFNENSEHDLLILWQRDYHEQKKQEIRNKREENRSNKGGGNDASEENGAKKGKKESFVQELPKNALLKVSNIKDSITREDIREYLEKVHGDEVIVFIEFQVGEPVAFVRYKSENAAERVFNALEEKEVELKEVKVKFEMPEEDEANAVLDRMKVDIFKRRQKLMSEKKGGKRFGGRKGGRGQKRSKGGDFGSNKRAKVDAD